MVSYTSLAQTLDEKEIAKRVSIPHDDARIRYSLNSNQVDTFDEFTDVIARYYEYHFSSCMAGGARLGPGQAASEAKQLLEQQLRRGEGDIVTWFVRARDGLEGGLRVALDAIAEGLKGRAVANYVREAFDRHVTPSSWEDKVEMIRQFLQQAGPSLSSSICMSQPERYAQDYQPLIDAYIQSLRKAAALFRRL